MQEIGDRASEAGGRREHSAPPARRKNGKHASGGRPKATLVHRMPGRVRFRITEHRNDAEFFDSVEDGLRKVPGIKDVETNPSTGSVLIYHDRHLDEIARSLFGSNFGELVEFVLESPPVARRLRSEVVVVDDALQKFSGGALDLGTFASFGLMGLAAVQLVTGTQISNAVSLVWYAAELLRRSSEGEPVGTPPD